MDVRLHWLLRTQLDLVAWWQLRALGWSRRAIDKRSQSRGWRLIHQGVYALHVAPLTQEHRWLGAVLTAPGTLLAGPSAAACWGFRGQPGSVVTVARLGNGGPRHLGGVRVTRSRTLVDEIAWHGALPITSPERTLIDLAAHLHPQALAKATREAIRLRCLTAASLQEALGRHRGRRGTAELRVLADRYAHLPLERARSDAESHALERLFLAGAPIPALNEKVGGFEADLVDHERKLIVEIDGPQFHLFPDVDEEKEAGWKAAGYGVARLPSDAVFRP